MPQPTLVPSHDSPVHIVLDDFGEDGRIYRETSEDQADFDTVVEDLLTGQYKAPVRVVAFHPAEGWARDVTKEVARAAHKRATQQDRRIPPALRTLIEEVTGASLD
jgi:hypothetical protein